MHISEFDAAAGLPRRIHRRLAFTARERYYRPTSSPKLRQSCQTCAVSKARCPREKPSCSRCESRGVPCEYVFTKRPGRKRASIISSTDNDASSGTSTTSSANSSSASVPGSAMDVESGFSSRYYGDPTSVDQYFEHDLPPESITCPQYNDASPVSPSMSTTPGAPDGVPLFVSALGNNSTTTSLNPDYYHWHADLGDGNGAVSTLDHDCPPSCLAVPWPSAMPPLEAPRQPPLARPPMPLPAIALPPLYHGWPTMSGSTEHSGQSRGRSTGHMCHQKHFLLASCSLCLQDGSVLAMPAMYDENPTKHW